MRCHVFSGCGIPVTLPSESQRPSSVRNWESEVLYSCIEGNIIYMYTYRPASRAQTHTYTFLKKSNEELSALLKAENYYQNSVTHMPSERGRLDFDEGKRNIWLILMYIILRGHIAILVSDPATNILAPPAGAPSQITLTHANTYEP